MKSDRQVISELRAQVDYYKTREEAFSAALQVPDEAEVDWAARLRGLLSERDGLRMQVRMFENLVQEQALTGEPRDGHYTNDLLTMQWRWRAVAYLLTARQLCRALGEEPDEETLGYAYNRDNVELHAVLGMAKATQVTLEDIKRWTDQQCQEAYEWGLIFFLSRWRQNQPYVPPRPQHVPGVQ